MQAVVAQHLFKPLGADEDGLAGAENVLQRIVDHGHQGNDAAEGDDDKSRKNQKPGTIVLPFFH